MTSQAQKKLITILFMISMFLSTFCNADIKSGISAYRKKEFSKAIKLLVPYESKNEPEAHYWLGKMYRYGKGTEKSLVKAKNLFEKGGSVSHPYSMWELANMYGDGVGVEQDIPRAEKLLKDAVKKSNPNQKKNLEGWIARLKPFEKKQSGKSNSKSTDPGKGNKASILKTYSFVIYPGLIIFIILAAISIVCKAKSVDYSRSDFVKVDLDTFLETFLFRAGVSGIFMIVASFIFKAPGLAVAGALTAAYGFFLYRQTDIFYLLDTRKKKILYNFQFLGISKISNEVPFSNVITLSIDSVEQKRKRSSRGSSSWVRWADNSVHVLQNSGSKFQISKIFKSLRDAEKLGEKLAKVIDCPFVSAPGEFCRLKVRKNPDTKKWEVFHQEPLK